MMIRNHPIVLLSGKCTTERCALREREMMFKRKFRWKKWGHNRIFSWEKDTKILVNYFRMVGGTSLFGGGEDEIHLDSG